MGKNELKILGYYNVLSVPSENRYKLSFVTDIINSQNDDSYQMKLILLGFKIISINNSFIKVELPERWAHIETGKFTSVVVDYFGRIRMEMNYKNLNTTIVRKLGYGLEIIRRDHEIPKVLVYFTDGGIRSLEHQTFIDISDYIHDVHEEMFIEPELTIILDAISDDLCKEAERLLLTQFPLWKNELAYWEKWDNQEGR